MSFSGTRTPEYKVVKRLFIKLKIAVQGDLINISDRLFSCDMISADKCTEFKDEMALQHVRGSNLVSAVLSKIEMDSRNYDKFICVLNQSGDYYRDIIEEMNSYTREDQHSSLQSVDPFFDSRRSDSETNALVRPSRIPYMQFEDIDNKQVSLKTHRSSRRSGRCLNLASPVVCSSAFILGFLWLYIMDCCQLLYFVYPMLFVLTLCTSAAFCVIIALIANCSDQKDEVFLCCAMTSTVIGDVIISLVILWYLFMDNCTINFV